MYVSLFYSIYKKTQKLKKNKYELITQNYKFKHLKLDKNSYQSFNLYYESWKDVFYFLDKKFTQNKILYYKGYNDEFKFLNVIKFYLSQLSVFLGRIFNKKIILIDCNYGILGMLKLIFKSFFKFCYFFPEVKKYKNFKIENFPLKKKSNDNFLNLLFHNYKKYIFSNYMNILFFSKNKKKKYKLITNKLMNLSPSYRDFILSNSNMKFYGVQHGGGYCVDQNNLSEITERKISDIFISWGKSKNNTNIAKPNITFKKKINKKSFICYISTSPLGCLLRFDEFVLPQYVKNNYFKDKYEIIKKLSNHKFETIVRLDKNDQWLHNQYIKKRIKCRNIIIDNGKLNFRKTIKNSSINLVDYLGSTYLESLFLNKPTIIYCNKKFFVIRKDKKKYFDQLKKMSIFFDDLKKLGIFLKRMSSEEKIQSWWDNKKLQSTIKTFNKKFQYSSKNWDIEMIKKFS